MEKNGSNVWVLSLVIMISWAWAIDVLLTTDMNGWAIRWMIALEPILLHIYIRSGLCSVQVKSLCPESLILSCWWTKADLTDWTKINVGSSNLGKIAFYTWLGGYLCIEKSGDSMESAQPLSQCCFHCGDLAMSFLIKYLCNKTRFTVVQQLRNKAVFWSQLNRLIYIFKYQLQHPLRLDTFY